MPGEEISEIALGTLRQSRRLMNKPGGSNSAEMWPELFLLVVKVDSRQGLEMFYEDLIYFG